MNEGASMDAILNLFRSALPTISYYINMVTKILNILASYVGIDLSTPEDDTTV